MKKLITICAVVVTILAIGGAAQATSISQPLSWWVTAGAQAIDDKIFTFTGSSLPGNTTLVVNTYPSLPGNIRVFLQPTGYSTSASLDYTLAINPSMSSGLFTGVTLSYSNTIGGCSFHFT